jgi:hypothetical protein
VEDPNAGAAEHPDRERIALGVRQPWAELILRGVKTIEVRTLPTSIRGPIYLYASKIVATTPAACLAARKHEIEVAALPRGLLVGTVDIVGCERCRQADAAAACLTPDVILGKLAWKLANPRPLRVPLEVRFLPYGVWFYPFQRKNLQQF